MGRKVLKLLGIAFIIAAVLLATIPATKTEAVVLDDFQLDHDSLDKYEGTATTVSIPNEIKSIGEEAFAGNQYLAQIDTGMNTESIEHGAFANCPYLYSVTTHDKLEKIVKTIDLARHTVRISKTNIVIALLVKAICLVLGALGIVGMWAAVFADVGVAIICIANSMRMLVSK